MASAKPIRIMLADDQKLFVDSVVALLFQKWPAAIIDTTNDYSSLFLKLKDNGYYDLIIVDLKMPKNRSEPSVESVRSFAPGAVLILISGSARTLEIDRALSAGIDAFVHKNQEADDLFRIIERLLGERSIDRASEVRCHQESIAGVVFSRREWQTLRLIATGLSTKEVAQALKIAPQTVKVYVRSLLKKTGCPNRTGLAVLAIQSGALNPVMPSFSPKN